MPISKKNIQNKDQQKKNIKMKKTNNKTKSNVTPVAVIGIGCLFPGSKDKKGYWQDITNGRDMVREVPPSHFLIDHYFDPDPLVPDKTYCRQGAFLDPIEFDPMAFGIPPTNLAATDTSQLLSLLVAQQVLNDAFPGQLKNMDRSRIGVVMGVAAGLELLTEMANRLAKPNWVKGMREAGLPEDEVQDICERIMATHAPWKESTFPGLLGNVVSGRIANYFDLGGINCTSDAACASSFSALSQGINELYIGSSDVVLVGGADTTNDSFLFVSFSKTPALSPTQDCRPFSDKADGMVLGEGIGMLAIKRLEDAERDGDQIYAVIRGIGASSDGKGSSIYAPCAQGQAVAYRRCYEVASYSPETVELLEAHGTATKPGDKAEIESLTTVFGDETKRKDKQWCALGSVKSQIGHTKSAAATAGIIKAVMGLHHKVLPPTIKVEQPNPLMEIKESPFYVNTECRPWVRDDAHPRRASVSSFGFGGTNFHVTVEEYKGPGKAAWRLRNVPCELVVLGAKNAKGLENLCRETARNLDTKGVLTYLARTSQESLDSSCTARLAVIATDEKDLENKLNYAAKILSEKPDNGFSLPNGLFCTVEKADPGDIAFLFPGQGTSGCLGMGKDLAMQFSDAMDVWDFSASFDRKRGSKEPLHKVVYPRPVFNEEDEKAQSKKLALTEWAQPAVMTTSISMSRILKGLDIKPNCVGGHSLGEISALFDAGVLDMESLFSVCFKRGELMAKVRAGENHGTMTAVLCDFNKAQALLDKIDTSIIIANHNSPSQIVLSGPIPDMEAVEEALKKEKIKFRRLPVSAAFHSSIMNEACDPFLTYIKEFDFKKAKVPIYSNISGKPHQNDPDKIRETLAKQIVTPVQFVKEIEEMYAAGVRTFIEVGSGCVLTNCVGKILENKPHTAVNMDTKNEHGITSLWKALAKLFIAGVTPDFSYLWRDYEPVSDPRKKEKPKFSVTLSGTNYGKPYPPPGGIKDYPKPNPPRHQIVPQTVNKEPELLKAESNIMTNTMNAEPAIQKPAQPQQTTPTTVNENPLPGVPDNLRTHIIQQQPALIENTPSAPLSGKAVRKDNSSWVNTYRDIQQQTSEAHAAYLKLMAESHLSFLKAAESANIAFSAILTGQPAVSGAVANDLSALNPHADTAIAQTSAQAPSVPEYAPASASTAVPSAQKSAPTPTPNAPVQATPIKTIPDETTPVEAALVEATRSFADQTPVSPNSNDIDFTEMLLDVVADKTGYPKEILTIDMDLELDLGIDSIKRVEIFSAINEENPWLPEVDPAMMADIKTLGDVIDFIGQHAPSAPDSQSRPGAVSSIADPIATDQTSVTPVDQDIVPNDIDFTQMLLDVVADKTGYPKEILTIDMDLELDLGIDSIKRVEIFSAINDENPWLPEVDPAMMADIKTLVDVIDFIGQHAPSAPDSQAHPATVASVAEPISATQVSVHDCVPDNIDFTEMLLDVVAEKTGYPKEILTVDMDLELDLGIDSIKRVEIFSAINDENPWLPEVDPAMMADIKTLGDVIVFIERSLGQANSNVIEPTAAEAPAIETQASEDTLGIGRYILRETPVPYSGFSMPGLTQADHMCIYDDESGIADVLAKELEKNGIKTTVVSDVPEHCDSLIFLGGLRKISKKQDAIDINQDAFIAAKTIAGQLAAKGGIFVTVQNTGGDFGLSGQAGDRVWLSGLTGLVKTAGIEWPKASVKAIDIDSKGLSAKKIASMICMELLTGGPELEVGLKSDGSRFRLRSYSEPAKGAGTALDENSVIVASGGARGITAKTLIQLAQNIKPRLALIGRTELTDEPECCQMAATDAQIKAALLQDAKTNGKTVTPMDLNKQTQKILSTREIQSNLEAMRQAGSDVRYIVADVTSESNISNALKSIRKEWGGITGIVHGAGVLADKLIAEKTIEQFDRVFNTKVKGLEALLNATARDDLKTICLFSSIAGRSGNMGQSDYAMANEILNKVADAEAIRRKGKCFVKSINWGPWDSGMVSPLLKAHFEEAGIPLIPVDVGAKRFVKEITEDAPENIEIVIGPAPPNSAIGISTNPWDFNLSLLVNKARFPFMDSHRIQDTPVVPITMVLEWFSKTAELYNPDMYYCGCKELKVLRGIKLDNFITGSDQFTVNCRQQNGDRSFLDLSLMGPERGAHYSAEIEMSLKNPLANNEIKAKATGLPPWKWDVSEIYKNMLFHGPEFQVIKSLKGVSDETATAVLVGIEKMSWPDAFWKFDVAALDGGLQLAILWGIHNLNKKSLPTRIGACYTYQSGPITGPIDCILNGKSIQNGRTVSDISFFNTDGRLAAKLCDVEMHMLPDSATHENENR
jgi:acyl transferase domain-containing protein/NAD(P)-dependent dehydrogenase (short-subunit alcohol dehydrogenase family)